MRLFNRILAFTAEEGGRRLVWAAVGGEPETLRGEYISGCEVEEVADFVLSPEGVKAENQLWWVFGNAGWKFAYGLTAGTSWLIFWARLTRGSMGLSSSTLRPLWRRDFNFNAVRYTTPVHYSRSCVEDSLLNTVHLFIGLPREQSNIRIPPIWVCLHIWVQQSPLMAAKFKTCQDNPAFNHHHRCINFCDLQISG
jgi:hypothetical protein